MLAASPDRPPVLRQRREHLGVHRRDRRRVDAERLQRALLDPLPRLQQLDQRLAVVGQQQEVVAHPAEFDMEQLAVRRAGVQHRDRGSCRSSLRGVDGGAVGMVEMPELRVGARQVELAAVGVAEPHPLVVYADDLGLAPVDEIGRAGAGRLAVAGPADPVAGAQLDPLGVADPEIPRGIARGTEAALLPVRMGEHHHAVLDAGDGADVVPPAPVVIAVERGNVARLVVPDVGGLGTGQAAVDQPVDREHLSVQGALQLQPLAHRLVGLAADRVRGGEQQGVGPLLRRQRKPLPRRLEAELFPGRLADPFAETLDRRAGLAHARLGDGLEQPGIALAQHLGHGGGLHPRLLQQSEGLARIHRPQLRRVAHQRNPGHPETVRDPEQVGHAHRVDHRGLVDGQHRAGVLRARMGEGLRVGEIAEAGQEVLEGSGRYPGLPLQHPRGGGRRREAVDARVPQQRLHRAQHGGLAAAGMALHTDHQIVRQQHRADRFLLPIGQPGPGKAFFDGLPVGERHAVAAPRPHRGQHAAFRLHRPVGDEGAVHPAPLHLDQVSVPGQAGDRRVDFAQRVAPRRVAQRHRPDLCFPGSPSAAPPRAQPLAPRPPGRPARAPATARPAPASGQGPFPTTPRPRRPAASAAPARASCSGSRWPAGPAVEPGEPPPAPRSADGSAGAGQSRPAPAPARAPAPSPATPAPARRGRYPSSCAACAAPPSARVPACREGRASPAAPGSPGAGRRTPPGTSGRSRPARTPEPVRSAAASPPCPAPAAAGRARSGNTPRSAWRSGVSSWAPRCAIRPSRFASCWRERSGCEAAGPGRGWSGAGTPQPPSRPPSPGAVFASPGPSPWSREAPPPPSRGWPEPPRHAPG